MINISNSTSKDNTPWLVMEPVRTATATGAPTRTATGRRWPGGRAGAVGRGLAVIGAVLLSWLAAVPRRLGDRLFAMNDTEAFWRGWQITKTQAGLGRRYRDPQFDTLAECPKCRGAGVTADLLCPPCLGTGRISHGEVS